MKVVFFFPSSHTRGFSIALNISFWILESSYHTIQVFLFKSTVSGNSFSEMNNTVLKWLQSSWKLVGLWRIQDNLNLRCLDPCKSFTVLSWFCFCVLKCGKTLREKKEKQNVIRRGKKKQKILWMLPGGKMWNRIWISFCFEKNVTAYEIWGPVKDKMFQSHSLEQTPNSTCGVFCHMTEQLVTDSESSGVPFSALTNLRLPITYHLLCASQVAQ